MMISTFNIANEAPAFRRRELFTPKAAKAAIAIPKENSVELKIFHEGKCFSLGFLPGESLSQNHLKMLVLQNGIEESLWALGIIDTPYRFRQDGYLLGEIPNMSKEERVERLRLITRKQMGLDS